MHEVSMEDKPWFKSYDPGMPHTLRPYPERTLLEAVRDTVQTATQGHCPDL